MKRIGILIITLISLQVVNVSAYAATKIFACPTIDSNYYGKSYFLDKRSGNRWNISWKQKATPLWEQASIPEKSVCGTKRVRGVPMTYQCVKFRCQSAAALATLGEVGAIQCYSSYVSTDKTFYCNDAPA